LWFADVELVAMMESKQKYVKNSGLKPVTLSNLSKEIISACKAYTSDTVEVGSTYYLFLTKLWNQIFVEAENRHIGEGENFLSDFDSLRLIPAVKNGTDLESSEALRNLVPIHSFKRCFLLDGGYVDVVEAVEGLFVDTKVIPPQPLKRFKFHADTDLVVTSKNLWSFWNFSIF